MTATWLDRIAADLLHVEQDIRRTLRNISRGEPSPRQIGWRDLRITVPEARTLLHGTMPAPIAGSRLRRQHGRLVAALAILSGHLVALNDPLRRPEAAIGAACSLMDELRAWIEAVRWQAAARRAGVKWPAPVAIRATMRLPAAADAEHLPNTAAGELHLQQHAPGARPLPHQLRQLRQEQLALDLAPPAPAQVIDLRQMRLALTPTPTETAHAHVKTAA